MRLKVHGALRLAAVAVGHAPMGSAAGKFVFASSGGSFQEAQNTAYVKPFAQKEGLELVNDSGVTIAQLKAAVLAKSVKWDVIEFTEADYFLLVKEDLIEPIDYSQFDAETLAAIDEKFRLKHGVIAVLYCYAIAYRTDLGRTDHPKNWAEFWDTKKFPGPRALPSGNAYNPPWTSALLADGVPPDKLYPLDFKRAAASLSKIKDSVKVWYTETAGGIQAIVSGEVDYASAPTGRIIAARAQGAKIDIDYGQALRYADYFVVPKGAPNKAAAMKFIAYASRAEPAAAMMKLQPNSAPNTAALKLLDPALAAMLPTAPGNLPKEVANNPTFYGEDSGNGQTWKQIGLKTWNEWYGR